MPKNLSYPHPVLGNADDVKTGKIEPSVSFETSEEIVRIHMRDLTTGNPTLDDLIAKGSVQWSVRVQCARTYFRKEFSASGNNYTVAIPGSELEGRVDVDIAPFATKYLNGYRPAGVHRDYGSTAFQLDAGEVVGVGPTFSFEVDKQFDPLRAPMASIMRVSKGEHAKGPFKVVLEGEFVEILLSEEDWPLYVGIKDRIPGIIHATLVLPVLAEALSQMARFNGHRWADRLTAILQTREMVILSPLETAQELLQHPLTRSYNDLEAAFEREFS